MDDKVNRVIITGIALLLAVWMIFMVMLLIDIGEFFL